MFENKKVFKNYNELCTYLNEPIMGGTSKIHQLKVWQDSFRWEKKGHKFIITNVIKPLEQREFMRTRKTKWYNNTAKQLLKAVSLTVGEDREDKYRYNELVVTANEAYRVIGLCNFNFSKLKTPSEHEVKLEYRVQFHTEVSSKFYDILTNLLNTLQRFKIISWEKAYRYTKEGSEEIILTNLPEATLINEITREILEEFKLKTTYAVMRCHQELPFYTRLSERLKDFGIYNCWQVYRIGFCSGALEALQTYVDTLEDIEEARLDINTKSIEYVDKLISTGELTTETYNPDPFILLLEETIPLHT